ncbi:hypothetical protein [Halalkalicoccus subterraneus]|uniref:hypothetical protein n=1 Tax=Halalkalicoccus subterraneus TaxID=2675002 RepID=UPI000EFA844E|nr:hypothetical protein [Halalkalicoccus subterraneus]
MAIGPPNAEMTSVQTALLTAAGWVVAMSVTSYILGRSLVESGMITGGGAVVLGIVIYVVESGTFE